jgi:hypothetical protein
MEACGDCAWQGRDQELTEGRFCPRCGSFNVDDLSHWRAFDKDKLKAWLVGVNDWNQEVSPDAKK